MKIKISSIALACFMPMLNHALTAVDLHRSFWGDYNQFNNNTQMAYQWYQMLLENRNQPGYMFKGFLHLLHQTNNTEQIILLMPQIEPAFEHDIDIQLLLAQTLQQAGHQQASDQKFIRLLDKAKDNQQVAFQAAQIFLRRKEPENAIQTIKDYLALAPGSPSNFIFHFLQAQVYLWMDKKKEALEQIEKSLDLHPGFDKGWLMSALLYEQSGQLKKAINSYSTYLDLNNASAPQVQEHLSRLALQQKLQETEPQLNTDRSDYEQALAYFNAHKFKEALQAIDASLAAQPKHVDGKVLKIQILNTMGQTDQAVAQLAAWFTQDPTQDMWLELIHLIALQDLKHPAALKILEKLQASLPKHALVTLYLADLYLRAQMHDKATEQLKQAWEQTENPLTKAQILTQLGSLYYAADQSEALPPLIKQAAALKHDYAPLSNLEAYWYASKGNDPGKAQALISKALASEPDNPFFADTQAYIYYKQKNYQAALELLEQSIKQLSDEPLILKHLVKCYIKCGKKDLAVDTLKQARLNDNEKRSLETFMKKMDSSLQ